MQDLSTQLTTAISVRSEHRMELSNVDIPQSLLGASFVVRRGNLDVEFALPGAEDIDKPASNPRLRLTGSHRDGDPAKNVYEVNRVILRVAVPGTLELPLEAPDKDPVAFERMYAVVEKTAPIAQQVLNEWTRTIRWTSRNAWIGRPPHDAPGWQGSLHAAEDGRRLVGTGSATATVRWTLVKEAAWTAARRAMAASEPSPLWWDLALEGTWHLGCGDLRRCVIDTAVACEVYLKTKVLDALPTAQRGLKTHLKRANISVFRERLFPDLVPFSQQSTWDGIKGTLGELFQVRNDLMHNGQRELRAEDCRRFSEATHSLLAIK
jgi:hypothetical protein